MNMYNELLLLIEANIAVNNDYIYMLKILAKKGLLMGDLAKDYIKSAKKRIKELRKLKKQVIGKAKNEEAENIKAHRE